ncbi:MAG: hypothetical protein K8R90_11150 [Candidatus Cloacimonetes bacterium]|nr:hypothetical protein [Candidatus Cloacimonadota bacterium]
MKTMFLCLLLAFCVGLTAIGSVVEEEDYQPVTTDTDAQTENDDTRMLVGELLVKYGNWFIETEDDITLLVMPDETALEQQECSISKGDLVILRGRFSQDRFVIESIQKNGIRYLFSE